MNCIFKRWFFLSVSFFSCFSVFAVDMQIKGALIEPPTCQVNDGGVIDVDFGERVGIKKVNGVNYTRNINYYIACQPGVKGWDLALELVGPIAKFDSSALQSDMLYLGVRVLHDKKPFPPGTVLVVDKNAPPVLEAVPIAEDGASLAEGRFSAAATLLARYQ
ncbi:pilus assembly protein [Serratia nevei]|uniref:fimbrial protein n=1 Tax=Serratia nevei TaxID=2703794 RepID=UPI00313D7369